MDIPSLSTAMASHSVATNVSTALTKKTMDIAEQQMEGFIDMMQSASPPNAGGKFDIRV